MVVVGYTELRDLTEPELALIPDVERDRKFGSDYRKQQFQCGRALLRLLLQEITGRAADSHEVATEEGGKPYCVDGPAISITHTGDRVACTVAQGGQVGIDLERIDEQREVSEILGRFFSEDEQTWVKEDLASRFFMLWVLKEAFVKAHGQSIFGGLEKLRCVVDPPQIDAKAIEGGFEDLSVYRENDTDLALATTAAPLDTVTFKHWSAASSELHDNGQYRFIASTNDNARKAAA